MPVIYREEDSPAWGTMAMVLIIALFALLIGYFAWWHPTGTRPANPPEASATK